MKVITMALSVSRCTAFVKPYRFYSTSSSDLSMNVDKTYQALCTEYYELDKPRPPEDALTCYLNYAAKAKGPILEPMCGTGRFLIPLLKKGYDITGFDSSSHMLDICQKKISKEGLSAKLLKSSFETFTSSLLYKLIFIPSGSFCLLTENTQVHEALQVVRKYLGNGGKFVFEIDTLKSINENQGIWNKRSVDKPDGTKLVLNTLPSFDWGSRVENTLSRYELWKNNVIIKTEVENFRVRLYEMPEIEELLGQHKLKVINKWRPYTKERPNEKDVAVLYECIKSDDCTVEDKETIIRNTILKGTGDQQSENIDWIYQYFAEYNLDGLSRILNLRISNLQLGNVKVLQGFFVDEIENNIHKLLSEMSNLPEKIVLIPLNLFNKHAVGLIFEKNNDDSLQAVYLDSLNEPIPSGLKQLLINRFGQKLDCSEITVERQKYANCAPELIENFIFYITGKRVSQEQAIELHSKLVENELLSKGSLEIFDQIPDFGLYKEQSLDFLSGVDLYEPELLGI